MKRYIAKSLSLLLAGIALLAFMLSSCSQELNVPGYEYVPEGEPARISIDVTVPAMSVQTRAVGNAGLDPNEDRARAVNDLWIGIYNVSSGVRTGQQTIFNQVVSGAHNSYGTITINNILTLSGMSYIVAVANVSMVKGISLSDGSTGTLQDLLAKADTWEKYKSIVRVLDDPVIQRGSSLVMSGVYQETDNDETVVAELVQSGTPPEVAIKPGQATTNKLSGRIHLRRLDSYIRVNLIPNSLINFTPKSWQIVNVPAVSYVHEQNGNGADRKPASQHLSEVASVFKEDTYFKSERYVGGTFRRDETGVNWFFDFYQMENKHQGLEGTNSYDDREREYKTTDGEGEIETNTGWYKSLVTNPDLTKAPTTTYVEDDANLANNNASYMVITGDLDYWIDGNNNPVASTTLNAIHRIAEATWTVHLGYCEGENAAVKAKDFNCRRNTKYTYNIYINGVDNIRVEAQTDDEPQPGAEGIVNDIITDVYSLDAHYGVFNIQLTDNQRRNFTWRIQAWFGGEPIDMIYGPEENSTMKNVGNMINLNARKDMYEALPENQFYNWIQIRPTSGEKVIAHYPGDIRLKERKIPYVDDSANGGIYPTDRIVTGKDGVWYLEDLRDVEGHPHPYDQTQGDEHFRWYTVFIDEYVWEYPIDWNKPSLTGWDEDVTYDDNAKKGIPKEEGVMDPTDWGKFVGEPNRRLWITSNNMYISKDRESIYNNAIYFVDQESVQTYYSEDASYGIGIESTNESYLYIPTNSTAEAGFTWKFTDYNGGDYDQVDGLWNQFKYAQRYKNSTSDSRLRWDDIYETSNDYDINGTTYRLRKGAKHIGDVHYDGITYYIRDHENEYMSACLSRNRDLNNDGLIGSNEIRWYLPTEKTYTRIILGAPSLRSPLFNINEYLPGEILAGTGTSYSHYAASNKKKIWAEELAATGNLFESGRNAGNLRCIRNIGQPTNWTPGNSSSAYTSVDLAYEHNKNDRTITMRYYDNTTLRQTYYGPGEYIRPHAVGSLESYAYTKFKYAQYDCTPNNLDPSRRGDLTNGPIKMTDYGSITINIPNLTTDDPLSIAPWTNSMEQNQLCRAYHEESNDLGTWRTPNITEIGILYLLSTDGEQLITPNTSYASCSQEYFNRTSTTPPHHRYMFVWFDRSVTTIGARYPSRGNFYMRCVKDVR